MGDRFRKGKASAEFSRDLDDFYAGFLDKVAPTARKVIDESLEKIERDARKEWPKRKRGSKGSARKFVRGYRVTAQGTIEGYLQNTAPYAWAIKFGADSENSSGQHIIQPMGKRVAQVLLVSPLRKESKRVVQALADDLADQAGRT
tara:strand:+ start:55 stop:492 length:438 start_codon:yes stop_codon:yes gene_type:complete